MSFLTLPNEKKNQEKTAENANRQLFKKKKLSIEW